MTHPRLHNHQVQSLNLNPYISSSGLVCFPLTFWAFWFSENSSRPQITNACWHYFDHQAWRIRFYTIEKRWNTATLIVTFTTLASIAAVRNYHKLCGINNGNLLFSQFWKLEIQDQTSGLVFGRPLSLAYRLSLSHYVFTWPFLCTHASLTSLPLPTRTTVLLD